jgi:hypothetical protein
VSASSGANAISRGFGSARRIAAEEFASSICIFLVMGALVACDDGEIVDRSASANTAEDVLKVESTAANGSKQAVADEMAAEEPESEDEIPAPLFPRGLITREPGVAPGYVLFNPLLSDTTYLVNNDGEVVHTWTSRYSPGGGIYLLPNGNLLRPGRDPERLSFRSGGTGGILQEIDWEGNVRWEWRFSDETRVQHHDIEPLPNGNLLVLAWEGKSREEARSAGWREEQIPDQGLWPDLLLEIQPLRPNGAKVVWEWHSWDHLIQNRDSGAENYGEPAEHPGRIDINVGSDAPEISAEELQQLQALGYVPEDATEDDLASDFLHTNAVAYHPRLDQIALSVPNFGEIWIIDHASTTEEARGPRGDLLYRWGNPSAYGRGDASGMRFFYQHDVRWIPDGWEGAGNLTVFNNGGDRPTGSFSTIDEWTPPLEADGHYAIGADAPFGPTKLSWQYQAAEPGEFYSPFISGAHRIANGNTLICSGVGGRFFEVTRSGEIVWEYRNPFGGEVTNADGSPPQPGLDERPFSVYRATRIPEDHPGLPARKLTALNPQPAWFEDAVEENGEPRRP